MIRCNHSNGFILITLSLTFFDTTPHLPIILMNLLLGIPYLYSYPSPPSQLYVSRIGFDSVLQCATSSVEVSLTDSLHKTSSNVLQMYSAETNRQSQNCGSSPSFKLEIDEHVVIAMIKIQALNIVTDSALGQYMKYVQSVHIDSLVQGEYKKFITSRSRAIVASSMSNSSTRCPTVTVSDTTCALSQTPAPLCVSASSTISTAPVTVDCVSGSSDVSCEGGMSDKEQQTLLYLSRCKAITSQHLKDMKSNLISTFTDQEAVVWTQHQSNEDRAEDSRAERAQSTLQCSIRSDTGSGSCSGSSSGSGSEGICLPLSSGVISTIHSAIAAAGEGSDGGSVQSSGVNKCQKKRSIGDI